MLTFRAWIGKELLLEEREKAWPAKTGNVVFWRPGKAGLQDGVCHC